MHQAIRLHSHDKMRFYKLINQQLEELLEDETNMISNLSNAAALLNMSLEDINWVGFYLMENNELLLGPFQGKPACTRIPVGKGVCGTAVAEKATQLVIDVNQFPGHIACDPASRSEIVIPIKIDDTIIGVLDIDSPLVARFDATDQYGLEEFVTILEQGLKKHII